MAIVDRWLLPDGVADVLPPQARRLEAARRCLLDLYETWGYEYVIPPMVEYLESLLTGTGRDLDLKTFKVMDLATGRTMGVRADITPQVARIDAHSLNREGVVRLCYAGTVVQSQADSMLASRIPLSVGAELFGDESGRADAEIVCLMVESLRALGFQQANLDLGDVSIFRQLLDTLQLEASDQELLFDAVQKKSVADIQSLCNRLSLATDHIDLLTELPMLAGDISVLDRARQLFRATPDVLKSIDNLARVAETVARRFDDVEVYFDLSELRGYAYHTGIVFAAYVEGESQVVAKGGRYDRIGEVFGRDSRGATGFSVDVRLLADAATVAPVNRQTVLVDDSGVSEPESLWQEIQRLRHDGYTVVESGESNRYDYVLNFQDGSWLLTPGEKRNG